MARKLRDYNDTLELVDYLSQRDPFSGDRALRCIATGVVADKEVNADKSKEIGDSILPSMTGKNAFEYTFRKKDQVITMASMTAVKFSDGIVQVDLQLLQVFKGLVLWQLVDSMRTLSPFLDSRCAAIHQPCLTLHYFLERLISLSWRKLSGRGQRTTRRR